MITSETSRPNLFQVDTGGAAFAMSATRQSVVSFTQPVFYSGQFVLTRPPSPADVSFGALMAFSPLVWALILAATLLLS